MFRLLRELKQLRKLKLMTKSAIAMRIKSRSSSESIQVVIGPVYEFPKLGKKLLDPQCKGYLLLTLDELKNAQLRMIDYLNERNNK